MRVALFHNLPSGGAKRHTLEQVRELTQRGHEVVEFAPSSAELSVCSLAPWVTAQRIFPGPAGVPRIRRVPLLTPYLNAALGLRVLGQLQAVNSTIAEAIDRGGFDVVLAKDCQLTMNPYILRYLRTPTVFQCHHGLRHRVEHAHSTTVAARDGSVVSRLKAAYYAPAQAAYMRKFTRDEVRNIRSATRVATNSEFSRRLLAEHYDLGSEVLYPGINTEIFHPLAVPPGDYVLCVAALIYSKGYRFLISALARIPAPRRPVLFIAANSIDPTEERHVRDLAAEWQVDIHIETIVNDERLREVYARARAFVYAPLQEALGIAPLEALACGTPVVAVAEGGVCETMREGITGALVQRDEQAFADRLDALLGDEPRRRQMSESGIAYVHENWTWRAAVDRLETQLREVRR